MNTAVPSVIAEYVDAINAGDLDRAVATFADDAYIAAERQARGLRAVRAVLATEFIDDHVTLQICEVAEHHGDYIVRTEYAGTYDKTNLPDPLIMTNYYAIRDDKVVTFAVISAPLDETHETA